ncbi:hypothetical protein BC827DRAFT_614858 [Russula dissimulans]|nr:hypothetical protein BC827DRAFT_614858 [Russula dissimulans]
MVLYQRPVRPLRVEAIPESTITDSKALSPLSGRPASLPTSPHADLTPLVDKQHVADVIKSLSLLFDSSAGNDIPVERRLSASWESLLKIKPYEENHTTSNLRATKIYADTLLDVHNEIVERQLAGAQELTRPCLRLNECVWKSRCRTSHSIPNVVQLTGHSMTHIPSFQHQEQSYRP